MKTETRVVTIEQEVYIAFDGTEFTCEDDCEGYEYKLLEKRLQCYDHNCAKCGFDICTYVKLVTEEDVNNLIEVCNYCSIKTDGIKEPGILMYTHDGKWLDITRVVANIYGGSTEEDG